MVVDIFEDKNVRVTWMLGTTIRLLFAGIISLIFHYLVSVESSIDFVIVSTGIILSTLGILSIPVLLGLMDDKKWANEVLKVLFRFF